MSPSFPPGIIPGGSPGPFIEALPTQRYLAGIALNDRINTLFDNHDIGSTRVVQIEQAQNRDGLGVVVKVDRKTRDIIINLQFLETNDGVTYYSFAQFQENIENVQGGPYIIGDGTKYPSVYVMDCTGKAGLLLDTTKQPPLRLYKVSIKCTAITVHRVPV